MDTSRRGFLKAAGAAALGVGGGAPLVLMSARGSTGGGEVSSSGIRWALAIDTQKCAEGSGCTACVEACRDVHNIPLIENVEEEVKWIWKEPLQKVFPHRVLSETGEEIRERPLPVMCNHCDNPPCVRVCPTKATWKRDDGIVMMDQHRCIGCRYCVVGCPYGARSFNWSDPRPYIDKIRADYPTRTKGVVEKCTFCAERLAGGQLPACVEACQKVGGAMVFGDLNDEHSEIRQLVRANLVAQRKAELGTRPKVHYKL